MEENKPLETDPAQAEGQEDVGTEEEKAELSLSDLNTLSGREGDNAFTSKDDFEKHYQNLKSLVGDQEAIKARKEQVAPEPGVAEKLADLENRLAEKDFLGDNPGAKDNLDLVKAYADANKLSLSEAWEKTSDKFATSGDSKLITNQRINPVKSADTAKLAEAARTGDTNAQERYVAELLGTDSGKL